MSPNSDLDVKGTFAQFPLAELLVELRQHCLNGSIRIANGSRKAIIYLRDGSVVHAVSNEKEHRLFTIGLGKKAFGKEALAKCPNFANDVELSSALISQGILSEEQLKELTISQIEAILIELLSRGEGEWEFSPHARLREGLEYNVDIQTCLINYARCVPGNIVYERFRSVDEVFEQCGNSASGTSLQPHEEYVLNRFATGRQSIAQLRSMNTLPESGLMQAIYSLWLGGFILRHSWNGAIPEQKLEAIRSSKLNRKIHARPMPTLQIAATKVEEVNEGSAVSAEISEPGVGTDQLTVEEYLSQVENAETFYDILGVETDVRTADLKNYYFSLAKIFHPDLFRRESTEIHSRVQAAFTKLAHAYETLRTDETRRAYDLKVKKELELRQKRKNAGFNAEVGGGDPQAELGLNCFEEGLEQLQAEDYSAAATQLARAVHYSPNNALYHAYFGQALSFLGDKYRHQAESEFQAGVKLDPKNSKIRMMLVEFYIDMDLIRRAEGELNRFLEIVPNDKDALKMLSELKQVV
ncbi:DUF4388 domain-containing protein [Leptolyngbya sp. 7M]|uniref:DUF4388 domain-containing protein n=1 Tax=Leptolyngbya sp. 7M TaxID=2812896 RepID=UPI001B8BD7DB|nr:DUF4388 domain-containing protein [Leptolyngbya sp. 7M]QYO65705.1 DnaJ domain-containing protein [Leptolyngbya sp. 7M]